jgi:hypothetical protein
MVPAPPVDELVAVPLLPPQAASKTLEAADRTMSGRFMIVMLSLLRVPGETQTKSNC